MSIKYNKKVVLGICFLSFVCIFTFIKSLCNKDHQLDSLLLTTKQKILQLKNKVERLDHRSAREIHRDINKEDVVLFLITPTYTRHTQQADLVRLSYTLKHVPNLHWIVVEDSDIKTKIVRKVLKDSGILTTHLNIKTSKDLTRGNNDPRWKKHRGVDQRNLGLKWLRANAENRKDGVVYFADDDNTYHLDLFEEMRSTKKVSMWPVALVGGLRWEGPICRNGHIVKFFTGWMPSRTFPVDMASFAINIQLLFKHPKVFINPEVQRGFLESDFLEQFKVAVVDVEAKAEDCSKILVWHTQTAEPNMKQEIRMQRNGKGSDPRIVV